MYIHQTSFSDYWFRCCLLLSREDITFPKCRPCTVLASWLSTHHATQSRSGAIYPWYELLLNRGWEKTSWSISVTTHFASNLQDFHECVHFKWWRGRAAFNRIIKPSPLNISRFNYLRSTELPRKLEIRPFSDFKARTASPVFVVAILKHVCSLGELFSHLNGFVHFLCF